MLTKLLLKEKKTTNMVRSAAPPQGADGSQDWDPAAHTEMMLPPGLAATGTNLQEHQLPRAVGEEGTGGGHLLDFITYKSKSSLQM